MTLSAAHIQAFGRGGRVRRHLIWLGLLACCWLLTPLLARAQKRPGQRPVVPTTPANVTTPSAPNAAPPDSARLGVGGRKGDIETTVKYQAKDSIRFNVQERKAVLYNKANVDYGDMSLKAGVITVDYSQNVLTAEGRADSTGRVRDKPVFKDATETYQAGRIAYNFKTRKGKISEAITQQGEGYIHAEVVKKNERNEIYGLHGRYTTCNLEHPHFYIDATKMKVDPGKRVVTGPFNLVIGDIPTPLGFLFGYFPTPGKSRASGFIFPTFGQAVDRGFYLTNGGYYWAVNEYMGLRVTGNVYSGNGESFGGFGVNADLGYRKRYAYDGRIDFSYSERPADPILRSESVNTNPDIIRSFKPRTFWFGWSHTPVPRPGGGRFSASVRTGSPEFNRQNSLNVGTFLTPAFNSTISYQKQLRNLPINYSIQAAQDLNTITGTVNLTLPDVTVGVQRQYLYRLLGLPARDKIYEQLAVAYQFTGQNRLTNTEAARTLESGLPLLGGTTQSRIVPVRLSNLTPFLRNAQTGMQHRFDITLGSFTLLRHFAFAPSVTYGQNWYLKKLNYNYIESARAVRIDTVRQFNVVQNYSANASLTTNVYGTVNFKGDRAIKAIRHRLTPGLTYGYAPDYFSFSSLYQQNVLPNDLRSPTGLPFRQTRFSRYAGFPFGIPGSGRVSQLSFNLQNQVEMKVRNKRDTTGNEPFRKVSLIDGLDFNTGYNFAADSFQLAPLSGTFRTQIAQKLTVLVSSTLDFYQRDSTGRRLKRLLFEQSSRRLARLDNMSVQLNYQFDSNRRPGQPNNRQQRVAPANIPSLEDPNQFEPLYADYMDFTIPWTLNASFAALYQNPTPRPDRIGQLRPRAWSTVSLNLGGEIKLTDKMRVSYTTGYDFINDKITISSVNFFRDLHCWQISGNWIPNGQIQGFSVTIGAKSALLQDLKLNRNRTFLNR